MVLLLDIKKSVLKMYYSISYKISGNSISSSNPPFQINYNLNTFHTINPNQEYILRLNWQQPIQNYSMNISQIYQNQKDTYAKRHQIEQTEEQISTKTHQAVIEAFLALPSKASIQFIGEIQKLKPIIESVFKKTTNRQLPENIQFQIFHQAEFEKRFGKATLGVSINRYPFISDVLLKENSLPELLLTAGHEIGHVLSEPIENSFLEEAKAYAFMLAWLKTIKENNIAGLKDFIKLTPPAKNGIHDRALNFVLEQTASGKEPIELFKEIAKIKYEFSL